MAKISAVSTIQGNQRTTYVYGPVKSWRSGTSLGIDPIGTTSTCSFNCAYCQLGRIQEITTAIKTYVTTEYIIEDLTKLEAAQQFKYEDLDVITFAGSGEPTLAANLGEMILAIKKHFVNRSKAVPISILTNATMLNDKNVRKQILLADLISLKLDAPNNEILQSINQPAPGISIETIMQGIKALKTDAEAVTHDDKHSVVLQLQIMIMPKFLNHINELAQIISELGINKIQINTPTRPKPVSKTGEYWLDTRGNHYGPGEADDIKPEYIEFRELPVISKEEAFMVEDRIREFCHESIPNLEIINVYKR